MTSPYELLNDIRNVPRPRPSRDEMCFAIAAYEADTASLSELKSAYRADRRHELYEFEKQADIELAFNNLPDGYNQYKVQP
jgi:hypothetical protein